MPHAILVLSTDAPAAQEFAAPLAQGTVVAIRQDRIDDAALDEASGIIVSTSVDQIDLLERAASLARFFARGGRMVFNGHVLRPFVEGLTPFVPLAKRTRAEYELTVLSRHAVFADLDVAGLVTRKGVAGFYGRGHNPPPAGAIAINSICSDRLPIDWEWHLPGGGALFVHTGNDLWDAGDDPVIHRKLAERLAAWAVAGADR
jgi:hypothetical protein